METLIQMSGLTGGGEELSWLTTKIVLLPPELTLINSQTDVYSEKVHWIVTLQFLETLFPIVSLLET